MWDLPGPGMEPVSPALAGGFLTTAPPGKPGKYLLELITKTLVQYHTESPLPKMLSFHLYQFYITLLIFNPPKFNKLIVLIVLLV